MGYWDPNVTPATVSEESSITGSTDSFKKATGSAQLSIHDEDPLVEKKRVTITELPPEIIPD